MRSDPIMADFFRDMDAGGPQAALRYAYVRDKLLPLLC